jgi:uncharacterized protein
MKYIIYNVKVIANAKKLAIAIADNNIKIKVNKPAVNGLANKAVIELLAEYFKVKEKCVQIIKGERFNNKVIKIIIDKKS